MKTNGPRTPWPSDVPLVVGIIAIALLVHAPLLSGAMILADYDAYVYFYPLREYSAARLLAGELPLWNPYLFMGVPHLANPQAAVFYPGSWLFLLLSTPHAYSLNLAAHVALAGLCAYGFARATLGCSRLGASATALCYMLGGALAGQAGHVNQLSAAAYLPAILLCADRALERISIRWAIGGAVLLAIQLLAGHPQVSYMTVATLGGLAILKLAPGGPIVRLARIGLAMGLVGLGIGFAAVQLVPTLELARLSIRGGGLDLGDVTAGSLPPSQLPLALLPGYWENPSSTEYLGYVGVLGLALAVVGAVIGRRSIAIWLGLTATLALILALGSATSLYEVLYGRVPGLSAFRVPARWLLIWSLCLSGLAGLGLDSLRRTSAIADSSLVRTARLLLVAVGVGAIATAAWLGGAAAPGMAVAAWLGLVGVFILLAFWSLRGARAPMPGWVLVGLLLAELLLARQPLPFNWPVPAPAFRPDRPTTDYLANLPAGGRVLSIASDSYEPEDADRIRAQHAGLPDRSMLNLLTALKWNEVLTPNLASLHRLESVDGYDGGVLPLRRYFHLAGLLEPSGVIRPDGVLNGTLDVVPPTHLLHLMGVGAVVASHVKDAEVDGLYFDRSIVRTLGPGESITISNVPAHEVAELATLTAVVSDPPVAGANVAEAVISGGDGARRVLPLRMGQETEQQYAAYSGGPDPTKGVPAWRPTPDGHPYDRLARYRFDPVRPTAIAIRNVSDRAVLRLSALTIVRADGELETLVLDDDLDRILLGDTRVYARRPAPPRAWLVHAYRTLDDDAALAEPTFDPRQVVLLVQDPDPQPQPSVGVESVRIDRHAAEEVTLSVQASAAGLLVVADPWYPGWRAEIDGISTPIYRANLLFRAVPVGPGEHRVKLVYDPISLKIGAALSAVAFVIALIAWLLAPRLRMP